MKRYAGLPAISAVACVSRVSGNYEKHAPAADNCVLPWDQSVLASVRLEIIAHGPEVMSGGVAI